MSCEPWLEATEAQETLLDLALKEEGDGGGSKAHLIGHAKIVKCRPSCGGGRRRRQAGRTPPPSVQLTSIKVSSESS